MSLAKIHWLERQEINEANPSDLKKGIMNDRVRSIKEKYSLTNEDLIKVFKENRKIMPKPKYWV